LIDKAILAVGTLSRNAQDLEFLSILGFEDLDGHLWENADMDLSAFPTGKDLYYLPNPSIRLKLMKGLKTVSGIIKKAIEVSIQ
jgi:hypothetical protein